MILGGNSFILTIILFLFINSGVFGLHFDISGSPYSIDESIFISSSESIQIDPGVVFYIAPGVDIVIEGEAEINGTVDSLISFLPQDPLTGWGQLKFINDFFDFSISYLYIEDGVLWSEDAHMNISHIDMLNRQDLEWWVPILYVNRGSSKIDNCRLEGIGDGEGLQIKDQNNISVTNCTVIGIPDALEISNAQGGIIENNLFLDMLDDAVDFNNCDDILVLNNIIDGATDRGFEIGSQGFGSSTNIVLRNNIVANCHEGINLKEGSDCRIYNHTFYKNNIAVISTEEIPGTGGSTIFIENSIFSQSADLDLFSDALSSIVVNYSLSDIGNLYGTNNIFYDPQLVDPANGNYSLQASSMAIDAGNPMGFTDTDCTSPDMGAIFYNQCIDICPCDESNVQINLSPNPFRDFLNIDVNINTNLNLTIEIISSSGQIIDNIEYRNLSQGIHNLIWYNENLRAGLYFLKFKSANFTFTEKIICIK